MMSSANIKDELNKMKKLLVALEDELSSLNIKEDEILELLEKNGLDTTLTDLIGETKKLQTNISNILEKKSQ